MTDLPILEFAPLMKELVWGGRKLETVLGKPLPTQSTYGESWEVVDLPGNQSTIVTGPFEGVTLDSLMKTRRDELLGRVELLNGHFPLLFKFIDAQNTLSVQVHPNESACERIGDGARPKTEAWYIIDAEPGAKLYAGLKPGVDKSVFRDAVNAGTVAEVLHEMSVQEGDYVFLPAGTMHAIGGGILLAEVQQSSNTTYRVFDWERLGLDGKPRELHIDKAFEATNFDEVGAPVALQPRSGRPGVSCDYFEMETVALKNGDSVSISGEGPVVIMGVGGSGHGKISAGPAVSSIARGRSRLVPSVISETIEMSAMDDLNLLVVRIPY